MLERRRHPRRVLDKRGHIHFQQNGVGSPVACMVKDISDSGARLIALTTLFFPPEFELSIEDLPRKRCLVKWRSIGQVGVEFVPPPTIDAPTSSRHFEKG